MPISGGGASSGANTGTVSTTGAVVAGRAAAFADGTGKALMDSGAVLPSLLTANSAISALVPVAARTDGTIEAVSGTSYTAGVTTGAGPATIGTTNPDMAWIFYSASANKVIAFYRGSSSGGYYVVGTISAGVITWGTPTQFTSSTISRLNVNYDDTNDRYFICYVVSGQGQLLAGKFSSGTFGLGSATTVHLPSYTDSSLSACWNTSANLIMVYGLSSGGFYTASYSGTGLTLSQVASVVNQPSFGSISATAVSVSVCYDKTNNFIWAYAVGDNGTGYSQATAISYSGGTFSYLSSGDTSNQAISGYNGVKMIWLASVSAALVISGPTAALFYYSGGSYSFGSFAAPPLPSGHSVSTSYRINLCYDSFRGQLVMVFADASNSSYLSAAPVNFTQSTLSAGASVTVLKSGTASVEDVCFVGTANNAASVTFDAANVTYDFGVSASTSTNASKFIGVSASAAAASGTTTLIPVGCQITGLSGLTPGSDYYTAYNGALTTTPTYSKIGYALSATTLLYTGSPAV